MSVTLQQRSEVYIRKGAKVPYQLVERLLKTFTVQMGDKIEVVSLDRKKPHTGQGPFYSVEPPWQGQPPRIAAFSSVIVGDVITEGSPVESCFMYS